MRLTDVDKKAKSLGIKNTWFFTKKQLIRRIQQKEGFQGCFLTRNNNCQYINCCWREDCIR